MTLLVLRQKMIQDMQLDSATEYLLMDNALTANYNSIKLQRMLGDLAIRVERELFQDEKLALLDSCQDSATDATSFPFPSTIAMRCMAPSLFSIMDGT